MSGIFDTPTNWEDAYHTSPPPAWDGSQYLFTDSSESPYLTYIGTFPTPAFKISLVLISSDFGTSVDLNMVLEADGVESDNIPAAVGTPLVIDVPACTTSLQFKTNSGAFIYGIASMTADNPVPFWQDFVGCAETIDS